ncbi:hypothetical protein [Deinococcus roseus]|uniref:hypothetical protein n=1 Tax=Deinococcus roseus TaxID=392414 RepID=UPI001663B680|nr:hypothetical protein [Deinococcus roseus]
MRGALLKGFHSGRKSGLQNLEGDRDLRDVTGTVWVHLYIYNDILFHINGDPEVFQTTCTFCITLICMVFKKPEMTFPFENVSQPVIKHLHVPKFEFNFRFADMTTARTLQYCIKPIKKSHGLKLLWITLLNGFYGFTSNLFDGSFLVIASIVMLCSMIKSRQSSAIAPDCQSFTGRVTRIFILRLLQNMDQMRSAFLTAFRVEPSTDGKMVFGFVDPQMQKISTEFWINKTDQLYDISRKTRIFLMDEFFKGV